MREIAIGNRTISRRCGAVYKSARPPGTRPCASERDAKNFILDRTGDFELVILSSIYEEGYVHRCLVDPPQFSPRDARAVKSRSADCGRHKEIGTATWEEFLRVQESDERILRSREAASTRGRSARTTFSRNRSTRRC